MEPSPGVRFFLMTRTPVLESNGEVVQADWLHLSSTVNATTQDWRWQLDSQLLVHLVKAGCVIDQYTEVDLSGALYNTRTNLQKVHELIHYALTNSLCGYTEDKTALRIFE